MGAGVFLVGLPASGKTAVGRELARRLGAAFLDTDALIVERHGPVAEIFAQRGEAAFRRLETETLLEAAALSREAPTVVSTGGGVVLAEVNREVLRGLFTVYLMTDLDTVAPRIRGNTGRPLLDADPLDRWARLLEEREALYRECSHLTIDARGRTAAELAEEIAAAYAARGESPRR